MTGAEVCSWSGFNLPTNSLRLDFPRADLVLEVIGRVGIQAAGGIFGHRVHEESQLRTLGMRQAHIMGRVVSHPIAFPATKQGLVDRRHQRVLR